MIIGITTTLNEADGYQRVNVEYINRVAATGAVPLLLTPVRGGAEANRKLAQEVIGLVDGLVITGGGDIHPRYYVPAPDTNRDGMAMEDVAHLGCGSSSSSRCRSTGAEVPFCGHYVPDAAFDVAMGALPDVDEVRELDGRHVMTTTDGPRIPCLDGLLAVNVERDGFELELARLAWERDLPTLGICRGMQVMNVALGGSLYRDLYNCGITERGHRQEPPYDNPTDEVVVAQGSLLAYALGAEEPLAINSMHHQGIDHIAAPLIVSARATDRVIEAVEDPRKSFYLGVQWHPEYLDLHRGIFSALASAVRSAQAS
ncbi:gamma-glutamyl-gamma-aminobutyrate hydrolase family protein [uncultured Adlercreutzia sp.]|uniref:gamma-glutamyl-gamma-aminobutyrate hydrolase family protein n=1 Tax=uncultured Adlercreutzia sp. TaxID=875803 RepID=UPI0026F392C6|nr:gamma-glutamyl-gamma-aminobutyrate hydrolase family protein [uncultured Adlercreutzia sp.]